MTTRKAIYTSDRTPAEIKCSVQRDIGERGSNIVKLVDGSVEVSSFPMGSAKGRPITALIVHDLSFIDRRQSSARNYVLAVAGVAASVLALFLGFVFWLLIRRWVNELFGDIRGRRFLDDARSEPGSRPLLTQIRRVLREVETTQRLEIDFHENWTPQALQQVVRDHLGAPEVIIVSNREPYIHNAAPTGIVVQVPASGLVTALEPVMRACSGTWIAHGSGTADREVVDANDRVARAARGSELHAAPHLADRRGGAGLLLRLRQRGHVAAVPRRARAAGLSRSRLGAVSAPSTSGSPMRWSPRRAARIRSSSCRTTTSRCCRDDPRAQPARDDPDCSGTSRGRTPSRSASARGAARCSRACSAAASSAFTRGSTARTSSRRSTASSRRASSTSTRRSRSAADVAAWCSYPISIEWPPRWPRQLPAVDDCRARRARALGICRDHASAVGVDRFDYTKGILERLHRARAPAREASASGSASSRFVQVAAPTRSSSSEYQRVPGAHRARLRAHQRALRHGQLPADHPAREHHEPREVFELYPRRRHLRRDQPARRHEPGRQGVRRRARRRAGRADPEPFAGAARELTEALIVNPYDVDGDRRRAAARAAPCRRDEQRERMASLRMTVRRTTSTAGPARC